MNNTFIISDWHFNHFNCLSFKCADGTPVRDFSSVDEMNETMIERHNAVVKPQDKVYFLGDAYFHATKKSGPLADISTLLKRLNGTLILIPGNHDDVWDPVLMQRFSKAYQWRMMPELGILLSHEPLHQSNMRRGPDNNISYLANIHGHIHQNDSPIDEKVKYINVCVEKTNYTPLHMDEVLKLAKA